MEGVPALKFVSIVHFGLYMDYKVSEEYVTTYSQFKELNGQAVVLTTFEIKILE